MTNISVSEAAKAVIRRKEGWKVGYKFDVRHLPPHLVNAPTIRSSEVDRRSRLGPYSIIRLRSQL
jgi:hypothetical protein